MGLFVVMSITPDAIPSIPSRAIKFRVSHRIEAVLRSGHPWLFDQSIQEQQGEGPPGSLGIVFDHRNKFLAVGLYDPTSVIRLRILQARKPAIIDQSWFKERLQEAFLLREPLLSTGTTGYRLVYGENDGLPGLVLDRYADTLVLKLYSCSWIPHLPAVLQAIQELLPLSRLVLRLSRAVQQQTEYLYGLRDGQVLYGEPVLAPVTFLENGLSFEAEVLKGQKTGFFLDQRDNRARVQALAQGKRVLNVFSFSGGFSVYAARGGARSVISLDLSTHALESAVRNFSLNPSLANVPHQVLQGDAFEQLSRLKTEGQDFDLVILDPPSFSQRAADRLQALKAYERITALGAGVVSARGILVTCSCSAHVSVEDFESAVERGLGRRSFSVIERTGHALDHPVRFKEGRYLKALFIQMDF
jgi:23S rRNA (cytosine1962-C5)-methyltransferase